MNNGEFYRSREYNYVGENKPFPAEQYKKPFEENTLGSELADSGTEITTLQKTDHKRKNRSAGIKNPVDRLFDSLRSIATSATVAVSAIVITSGVVAGTLVPGLDLFGSEAQNPDFPSIDMPDTELPDTPIPDPPAPDTPIPDPPAPDVPRPTQAVLISIDVGSDYAEFEIEITDISEGGCYLTVSTDDGIINESYLRENGRSSIRVDGLLPETAYAIKLVSADGETVLLSESFLTEAYEYTPEAPPDSYTGVLQLPSIDLSEVDWNNKLLGVPIAFDNVDGKYYYILKVDDGSGNVLQSIRGEGDKTVNVSIPDGKDKYSFTFEIYGVGEVETKLIESHDLGTHTLPRPKASVTDVKVVDVNTVGVRLSISNADKVSLRFTFRDGSYLDRALTSTEKSAGYAEIELPDTATEFTVTPTITRNGYTVSGSISDHLVVNNLQVDTTVYVSTSFQSIDFRIKAMMNGATALRVVSSGVSEDVSIYDGVATYYYNEYGPMTLTLYLTNELGDRLSEEATVTVDTSSASTEDFTLNYSNPGDAGVSYNANGTVNIYLYTGFESTNPDYYCRVMLNDVAYVTRERVLEVKNLPDTSYSLRYDVCFERDGITYAVHTVIPSGMVNEVYYYSDTNLTDNVFTMTIYDPSEQDLNSIVLTSSDGQRIALSESDFADDGGGILTATVTFENVPEFVTIDLMIAPFGRGLELVDSYVGSPYTSYSIDVYPD